MNASQVSGEDFEPEEADSTPLPIEEGRVLEPGDYLLEGTFARPADAETCRRAFGAMGWGDERTALGGLIVDESPRKEASTLFRFTGRLTEPITIEDTGLVRYDFIHKLTIDPFDDLRQELYSFKLIPGEVSEMRFLHRLGRREAQRISRDVVEEVLRDMGEKNKVGFRALKLTALQQNMRLPDRPNASHILWLGILRWEGPPSVVTMGDPFYFEDMAVIAWKDA